MLALAAHPLGIRCVVLDPSPRPPAADVATHLCGALDDVRRLEDFAARVDVVTYEWEAIPLYSANWLAARREVRPAVAALALSQDRLLEKRAFARAQIPTAPWRPAETHDDLCAAGDELGYPLVLKRRRGGYDGRGQVTIMSAAERDQAWAALGDAACIVEGHVHFDREVSLVVACGQDRDFRAYPLVENHHEAGILRRTFAPAAGVDEELQSRAESYARRIVEDLDYAGIFTLEFFQVGASLLANEMAPRVHNSGHWTIEGAQTSQFQNHVRAILELPLGSTLPVGHSAMVNLIGSVPDIRSLLSIPDAAVHLYGKEPRPGRKVGHVTIRGTSAHEVRRHMSALPGM
ncbi:MAG: 5-(carboxyamino)imidazole ribonucleotide synthase [Chloroflexota bacterium]